MFDYFSPDTPWEIREQILRYQAAQHMSDSERARFFKLPEGCRMREGAKIISPDKLSLGQHCWIGEHALLDASGELEIGAHTSIGLFCLIFSHDSHMLNLLGTNTPAAKRRIIRKKTSIGSHCFIGGHSFIMPGVTIGDHCLIAPMSVVYQDLPPRTIYQPYRQMLDLVQQLEQRDQRITSLEARLSALEARLGAS